MSSIKVLGPKNNIIKIITLGFIALGIGLTIWALINVEIQSAGYSETYIAATTKQTVSTKKVEYIKESQGIYVVYPIKGEKIGSLTFPTLKQTLSIFQGTSTDELKRGVGHFLQSVLPGENDNCVLSGHRDTVFSKMGKIKIGDQAIVKTSAGTYIYVIKRIRIVDKNDKTVIVPTDHAVLTLTTCYPFTYIGSAPKRYILMGDLQSSK